MNNFLILQLSEKNSPIGAEYVNYVVNTTQTQSYRLVRGQTAYALCECSLNQGQGLCGWTKWPLNIRFQIAEGVAMLFLEVMCM